MRILVLANNLLGLYSFRKEVMKAFVDEGDEVVISAPYDEKAPEVEKLGCKIIDTQFNRQGTNPIDDFKLMWRYYKLIKQIKPGVSWIDAEINDIPI